MPRVAEASEAQDAPSAPAPAGGGAHAAAASGLRPAARGERWHAKAPETRGSDDPETAWKVAMLSLALAECRALNRLRRRAPQPLRTKFFLPT
jgi:hypothetical protein